MTQSPQKKNTRHKYLFHQKVPMASKHMKITYFASNTVKN